MKTELRNLPKHITLCLKTQTSPIQVKILKRYFDTVSLNTSEAYKNK